MNQKRQKKVLQLVTKSNFGGAQKYVYEISSELKERGFDVVVGFGENGILKDKLQKENIRTINIDSLQRDINIFSDIASLLKLIKLIRSEKPDIIHLNSSKIGALGGLAARICFVPKIIFTVHGLAFNENRSFFAKLILKMTYFLVILMSHYSIAVSENIKKQLLEIPFYGILKNKVKVVKNGIKEISFYERQKSRNFIGEKINQNIENKKIIGTIAELHHIKGLNYLIEAARKLTNINKDIIFVVFGEGEERKNLEKLIRENGLTQNFFLLGFVEDGSRYMKGFDLFVLPSLSEALALVILEAKQAGLKIVASNVGGIPEALGQYKKSLLFETKNVGDLTEKIKNILKKGFTEKDEAEEEKGFEEMINKNNQSL